MKTNVLKIMAFAAIMAGAAACSDNNDGPTPPEPAEPVAPNSILVVNNGVQSTGVPGTVTLYNETAGTTTDDIFSSVNKMSVGDTPQDIIAYGKKIYISVFDSNCIWVLDAKTLEVKQKITPEAPATGPRNFAVAAGKVYVSLYSGHVAAIDTAKLVIDKTFEVGPNPERIAVKGNSLYVANSDGMNWMAGNVNSSLSIVNLATMEQTFHKIGDNVTSVVTNGTDVFALCMGNYGDIPATVKKIAADGTATEVCPGTIIAINGTSLYVINDPAATPGNPTYTVYNTTTGTTAPMFVATTETPTAPCGIAINSTDGSFVVLARNMGEFYPLYTDPGVAYLYNADTTLKAKFNIGINPSAAIFASYNPE